MTMKPSRLPGYLLASLLLLLLAGCGSGGDSNTGDTGSATGYNILYDGNGNTGGQVPIDAADYAQGDTVTVLGNTGNLVNLSQNFVGWNTQADGSGDHYTQSQTFSMGTAGVTLYAQWSLNPTYSVTYDGNGNTGGSVPVDSSNYAQGQTVTVLDNTGNLVNLSHSFVGWNTQADGSGTGYTQSQTFSVGTADVTLYAQWTLNPTFSVSYDGNGNTGGSVPIDSTNYETGHTVTVAGNTALLVNAGYSFSGWNTQTDGSGTGYSQSQTFSMGAEDVTLYAQWNPNPTYSVTYNGNGNTGGNAPVDSNNYEQGQTVTVLGNTGNFSNTGYSFAGWNTESNGSGAGYTQSQTFTMGAAEVTLYAQWSANPTYSMTYNGNGNTGGSVPVDSTRYEQGQTVTVLGNTAVLQRTGYSFSGWNTQADSSGTGYAPNDTFAMADADVTLYAQWNPNPTYSVTYTGNGSTGGSAPVDSNSYEQSQVVTVLGNTGNFSRTGYSFAGWNTQADGSGTNYTQSQTFAMGTADVTLYAAWTLNPTYSVTYNGNSNTGGSVPIDSTNYEQGQSVTVLGNSAVLVRTGYSFAGWNTQTDGSGTGYTQSQIFSMGTTDVTLFAQWTLNPTYSVTYNGNGSTGGSAPVDSNNYEQGQTVTVLGNTGNFSNVGYTFAGWNTQSNGSGTGYTQSQTFSMGIADVILYAQWTLNPTYSVTYNGNGNTGGSVPVDSTRYEQGQTVTVLGNTSALVRTGYNFSNWNTRADGGGTAYAPNNAFAMGTANVTLYAQWTAPLSNMLYNAGTSNGNLGGFSGAVTRCLAHKPAACGDRSKVEPFLSGRPDYPFDSIETIPDHLGISSDVAITGPTGIQISANWAGLVDGPDVSLAAAGILPHNTLWWSGSTSPFGNAIYASQNCFVSPNSEIAWVNSGGALFDWGQTGMSSSADSRTWLDHNTGDGIYNTRCNAVHYVVCVCGE
ncbi:MAG: InlB B-repeat-containing protein [Candidatus Thiodiazotropha sp. (ex Monitilora ramsayi)]|nr:InlB B-repeat-containing protein [Candidatus Thiodiazotropha sp. (ex Monitilora ramsayi)]